MNTRFQNALTLLKKHNQEHLLAFYGELSEKEQNALLLEIEQIDFALIENLLLQAETPFHEEDARYAPIAYTVKEGLSPLTQSAYTAAGEAVMKKGAYAVITMAGGQGTRLGHDGPKGTYRPGLPGNPSLFELQYEKIREKEKALSTVIPWYIMTSRENHAATVAFFEENNYFGAEKENISFFIQRMLPMLQQNGKIILESKSAVKLGADGHGGLVRAMVESGALASMQKRGIQWVYIGAIDNILSQCADPLLVGFAKDKNAKIACKSLVKCSPEEKVGVFCYKNGAPYVVEYIDITPEMANAVNENGDYLYGDAHILCNLFSIEALESLENTDLPYHTALKKTAFVNESGEIVTPDKPNAYKFESFIFDAFLRFENLSVLRVRREEEFAPIKNKDGIDSPATARGLYTAWKNSRS